LDEGGDKAAGWWVGGLVIEVFSWVCGVYASDGLDDDHCGLLWVCDYCVRDCGGMCG
jgi:hypothetical protein